MIRARPLVLVAGAVVGFVIVLLGLAGARRLDLAVPAPTIVPALIAAFAVVLVVLGWRVRQFIRGRTSMDPIAASRVAALAVSGAFVGAVMIGVGLAQWVAALENSGAPLAQRDQVVGLVTAGLAAVLVVVGLVVQHWCEIPEDPDDGPDAPA